MGFQRGGARNGRSACRETADDKASTPVVIEAIAVRANLDRGGVRAVIDDDTPDLVLVCPIPVHLDDDLTTDRAKEVRDANAFGAAEQITVRDLGVQAAGGIGCTEVSHVHAARAVAGRYVGDGDPCVQRAPEICFNRAGGAWIPRDG